MCMFAPPRGANSLVCHDWKCMRKQQITIVDDYTLHMKLLLVVKSLFIDEMVNYLQINIL